MKILLTGSNGYIGSVMEPILKAAGHEVTGLDTGYFEDCHFIPNEGPVSFIRKDIRDLDKKDIEGYDAIVHLAALSNDPIGNLHDGWTRTINLEATTKLARLARDAGVSRFLFASSCIMYGSSSAEEVTEEAPLAPATEYARSKADAEVELRALASAEFSPVFIRNGTVYGVSPRMRFDTVLNNFVGQAVATGKVLVLSNGEPWRPVVHVKDISKTFLNYLEAPREIIHNQAFNNGAEVLNHRVRELAQIVVDTVPGSKLEIRNEASADQRTYKANFDKFATTFPDFKFDWNPRTGAKEVYDTFVKLGVNESVFNSAEFTRLKWLKGLLDSGKVEKEGLRWTAAAKKPEPVA
jgi:nucleoside-diphosphate-sugar epimerase